ncbi:MAG: hypothetical protein ACK4NW_10025 [Roseinatronobacter sp.]
MPIKWRSKILLCEIEATYGTDATPTGADNAVLATEVSLTPMQGNDISRELDLPWMGGQGTIPAELHMRLTYRVEMVPSGTVGTPPAWGPILRACAVAEVIDEGVSVTYNPVSDGHESVTHYLWIGATLYKMRGGRGTCVMRFPAQGIPYLEFDFLGLFAVPVEETRVTPALTAFLKPDLVTSARTPVFNLNGNAFVMRSAALNLGNQVEGRFLVGSESILITDKADTLNCTVEAVPVSTFNPIALAESQASVAMTLQHGNVAGRIATLEAPTAQMQRLQSLENQQMIKEWPLRLVPVPATGNDQWTLTLT